jgi:hypothetical protein
MAKQVDLPRRFRFHEPMRFFLLLALLTGSALGAAVPPDLAAALKTFRADGPRGWSFTQITTGDNHHYVERYDASRLEPERWSLVESEGHPPSADEQHAYMQNHTNRSGAGPQLAEAFDLSTVEPVADTADYASYRCRLRPGSSGDKTARFLTATLRVHKPTHTIVSVELASAGEFSPAFIMTISEMKTTMTYSLPAADRPSLLQKVTTHLRGRAFYFKSLDADMTVTYTDYKRVSRR